MNIPYWASDPDMHEELAPLIKQLAAYDKIKQTLESEGGSIADLNMLTEILEQPMILQRLHGGVNEVSLSRPVLLRKAIRDLNYDLFLDVRQSDGTRLPVYYLSRAHQDYLREYSLVVEDYYMSPGYRLNDPRFVKFMHTGHEIFFLRLSQFRDQIAHPHIRGNALTTTGIGGKKSIRWTDKKLCDLGRHVFQAMWHEHQRLGFATAQHMTLPVFRQTVEVLYLSLSGDLCALRAATDRELLAFFKNEYPQPFVRGFMQKLAIADGRALSELPLEAIKLYKRLQMAFGIFLQTDVQPANSTTSVPLWKLIYGNLDRLESVAKSLSHDAHLTKARAVLEKEAQNLFYELLEKCA